VLTLRLICVKVIPFLIDGISYLLLKTIGIALKSIGNCNTMNIHSYREVVTGSL